jgi:hypothetical protein
MGYTVWGFGFRVQGLRDSGFRGCKFRKVEGFRKVKDVPAARTGSPLPLLPLRATSALVSGLGVSGLQVECLVFSDEGVGCRD